MRAPGWSVVVPPVQGQGLHAVTLSAEFLGCSRADLGDIRLLDSTGAQVPYVIEEVWEKAAEPHFVPFTLLRNEVLAYSTVIELERPEGRVLDELYILIRPLEVAKKLRITGSDDRNSWYMVRDEYLVTQGAIGDPPRQVLMVGIPPTDFRYLRLALNDSLTPPMSVLDVGRFDDGRSGWPRYVEGDPIVFSQIDTNGSTILRVLGAAPMLVERLWVDVDDTVRYARNAQVRTWTRMAIGRKHKRGTVRVAQKAASFSLTSEDTSAASIPDLRLDTFDIVIDNGNDRPLHFRSLRAQVQQRVLLANLSPAMHYHLTTGDALLDAPRYDMVHFADELSQPLDTLTHGAMEPMAVPAVEGPAIDPSKWWVWGAILFLMLTMAVLAFRLMRKT